MFCMAFLPFTNLGFKLAVVFHNPVLAGVHRCHTAHETHALFGGPLAMCTKAIQPLGTH